MPYVIGLVIAVAIIIAYLKAMGALFANFFLDAFLVAACIALLVAPIVYGYGAWETFAPHVRGRGRAWLWLPVLGLLIWLSLDLGVLMDALVAQLRAAPAAPDWLRWQESRLLTALAPFLADYAGLMRSTIDPLLGLPVGAAGADHNWLYALYGIALKVSAIVMLLLGLRGFANQVEDDNGEPAYRQYFFGAAWLDLWALLQASAAGIGAWYRGAARVVGASFADYGPATGFVLLFFWPLVLAVVLALFVLPAVLGALFLPLLFGIHALALAVIALLFISLAWALLAIESSILWARSGWAKCPHPKCYQPVKLPVYRCACGARHKRLVPGRYGVFSRICSGCGRALPTLSWFGKHALDAECSHETCGQPLHNALFGGNLTIPLYGGAAAGKTMFRNAAVVQIMGGRQPDLQAELIDRNDRDDYQRRLKPEFDRGVQAPKTTAQQPPAYLLALRRGQAGLPVSLYLYDPDGRITDDETHRDRQRYLRHAGGLALLIDPLSFPALQQAWLKTGAPLPLDTCQSKPLELVEGLIAALEGHTGLGPAGRYRRRLAVILTKGDLTLVQQQLGVNLAEQAASARWDDLDAAASARIRAWLAGHEPAFLQRLDNRFARVEFFLISAMGHPAAVAQPFTPRRVLEPLRWLLAAHGSLRWPGLTRALLTAAEVAIVAVLGAAFLTVPWAEVTAAGWLRGLARAPLVTETQAWRPVESPVVSVPSVPYPPPPRGRSHSPPPAVTPPVPAALIVIPRSGMVSGPMPTQPPAAFSSSFTTGQRPFHYFAQYRDGTPGTVLTAEWFHDNSRISRETYSIPQANGAVYWTAPALTPGRHRVRLTQDGRELAQVPFTVIETPAPAGEPAVVNTIQLNVRSGPGTENPVQSRLSQGQPVMILERRTLPEGKVWARISATNASGWVNTKLLSPGTSPPQPIPVGDLGMARVNTTNLNLRADAGPDYRVITRLPRDTLVEILERRQISPEAIWARIRANGQTGWVNAKLLRQ